MYNIQSVQFEDNLTSHKSPQVLAYWDKLNCVQKFYPPNLTQALQAIDRHIGLWYKTAVYRAVRGMSIKQLREHKKLDSLRLSPLKKRILITKTVADTHESLARSSAFKRAFIATGTWLPYDHSFDGEVALQGVA